VTCSQCDRVALYVHNGVGACAKHRDVAVLSARLCTADIDRSKTAVIRAAWSDREERSRHGQRVTGVILPPRRTIPEVGRHRAARINQ
jgi:hypothetical protein